MLWLLAIAIGVFVLVWWRSARQARDAWLQSLNLVGKWELAPPADGSHPSAKRSLTLSGTLARGDYVARDDDAVHRGQWRLSGNTLTLAPTEGEVESMAPRQYELRLFETGKIGIDGADREREIYLKRDGNVIPLTRRPKRRG